MKSEGVKSKNPERFRIQDFLAPPAGLEPATSWLTVMRSANWAKEEYIKGYFSYPYVSAMTYFSGPSPAKYFRHCKA